MKKPKQITIPNLKDLTYLQALTIAHELSRLSYEEIAERMGKGRETIHRYFTDPAYNPPTSLVPKLCRVLGNYLLIEWQAAQVDGYLTFETGVTDLGDVVVKMGELTKEFSDVLKEDGEARKDGEYDSGELERTERELDHLIKKGIETKDTVRSMRHTLESAKVTAR